MDWCEEYGIKVLMDVHAVKDSQNGFDNSGQALSLEWTDENNFKHWSIESANWLGTWEGWYYSDTNWDNVAWSVAQVTAMMERWGSHAALYAFEPVNEPWWASDITVLSSYYQQTREVIRLTNPDIIFVFHDAFNAYQWNDLFDDDDMDKVAMDTHQYMGWWERKDSIGQYCDDYGGVMRGIAGYVKYPIWVGEWSLATDVCAHWLGGFNDSNTEYQFDCQKVDCPYSYFSNTTLAVDFDRNASTLGPYGESNRSTIEYGQCYIDSDYFSDDDV